MTWTVMEALVTSETASWQLAKAASWQGEWETQLTVSTPCRTPTSPPDPYKLSPFSPPAPPFTSELQLMESVHQHACGTTLHENTQNALPSFYQRPKSS